jgi:hypothetical protein
MQYKPTDVRVDVPAAAEASSSFSLSLSLSASLHGHFTLPVLGDQKLMLLTHKAN